MELIKELQDGKLSDAGWEQYHKYADYYNDKYMFEYSGAIDFVAFIEDELRKALNVRPISYKLAQRENGKSAIIRKGWVNT